jgi:hypothetical protein
MENERLFFVSDDLRVLLRGLNQDTYIAFESNGQRMVFNANAWEKLKPLLHIIDEEFVSRRDFGKDKLFPISDGFKVMISEDSDDIYVNIELSEQLMRIEAEKWVQFKENIAKVNDEFDKRYSDKLRVMKKRSLSWDAYYKK